MGEKRTFQTAGMFEIIGSKEGEKIEIASDKAIDIKFASKYPGAEYNFFYMNPEVGKWEFIDYAQSEPNLEKQERLLNLKQKEPKIKFPMDEYFVLNRNMLLDIYFKNDHSKIWENRNNNRIWNKFKEYGMKFYDLNTYGEIRFERGYYHPAELLWKDLDESKFPRWANDFEFDWVEVNNQWTTKNHGFKSEGENVYTIWYKTKKGVVFSKKAEAIISLKSLLKYPANEWQKQFDNIMADLKKEQEEVDIMAETYRTFSIKRMGMYNYDKLQKLKDWFDVNATFSLSDIPEWPSKQNVILILGDNSGYYTITPKEFSKIRINPESKHRIIALAGDQSIMIYPVEELASIQGDSLRAIQNPNVAFTLINKGTIKDAVSLREMLGFK